MTSWAFLQCIYRHLPLACSKKAREFYFVDGLAGEGLYHFPSGNEYVLGSSIIALRAEPMFRNVLSMELDPAKSAALATRTRAFGSRSIVIAGDCNADLAPAMKRHIPPRAPTLVLLDPEGLELRWATVATLAGFREGERKAELLILIPTGSVGRVAEAGPSEANIALINSAFPESSGWADIWARRRAGRMTAEQCRDALAESYRVGLTGLGYRHTEVRPITQGGDDDASVYHLVFASDHPAGQDIMVHTFKKMYSNPSRPGGRSYRKQTNFLDQI